MKKILFILLSVSVILFSCEDSDQDQGVMVPPTPSIQFQVVNEFPHDTASFTQGLLVHEGKLYESTGMPQTSWLGPLNLATGAIDKKVILPAEMFGEGITILNNKLYHLTWQNKKGFIYDPITFKKLGEFPYVTEGWGLTNDGENLIISDGTSNLFYYTPDTVKLVKTISVTDNFGPVPNLNELEFIDGFIYANQWQTPYILKINPADGKVVGKLDFKKVQDQLQQQHRYLDFSNMTLNGIAYDSATKKIYVTGKNWPVLYEIRFS